MTPTMTKFECPNCGDKNAVHFGLNGRCDACKEAFTFNEQDKVWELNEGAYKAPVEPSQPKKAEPEKVAVLENEPEPKPAENPGVLSRLNQGLKNWGEEFIG